MKILIILHKAKKSGGLVLQFLKMAKIYKQKGHEVKIFSMDSVNNHNSLIEKNIVIIKNMNKIIADFNPSIIITSDPFITTSLALISRNKKIPIISRAGAVYHSFYAAKIIGSITSGTIYTHLYYFLNRLLKFVAKISYKNLDFVIFNSQFLSDIYSIQNSCIILNGVEVKKIKTFQVHNPMKLVFVGRVEPRKSLELIINALTILKLNLNNFEFCLVGETSLNRIYWTKISNMIKNNHLDEQVKVLGKIDNQKLPLILQEYDILLFSSDERNFPMTEGLPNVILEGMANGLAIIATNVAGVSEIVNENNGFLVDSDPNNFAEKISFLMSNNDKLIQMKKANNEAIIERNNIVDVSKKYLKIFKEIIKREL